VTGDLLVSGPNSHPYVIERRNGLSVTWQPTSSTGTMTIYRSANYTSRLPTPGATAAWRADCSPPLPRQSGQRPQVVKENAGQSFGNENLTLAQLQALPSSTAGLKEAIVKGLQAKPNPYKGAVPVGNTGITDVCVGLIRSAGITPGVRAAAFRIIAAMPGISVSGLVKDPLGRTGYDVTLPGVGGISVEPGATGTNATPKAQYRMVTASASLAQLTALQGMGRHISGRWRWRRPGRQSHQPLPFALFAISSHKWGKTAGKTTSSRTKRAGVTDVMAAIGHGREVRAVAVISSGGRQQKRQRRMTCDLPYLGSAASRELPSAGQGSAMGGPSRDAGVALRAELAAS
jgi:hypothetical protein